jgi:hypothetical protein
MRSVFEKVVEKIFFFFLVKFVQGEQVMEVKEKMLQQCDYYFGHWSLSNIFLESQSVLSSVIMGEGFLRIWA